MEDGGTEVAPGGPYVIRCRVCRRKLMRVSYSVIYRPKTLDDLSLVRGGQEGAWCGDCEQVTVFARHPSA